MLGSVTPINLPFDRDYWLGTKIGADSEMTPRQQIVSGAYSFRAETASYSFYAGTATYALNAGTGTQGLQGIQGTQGLQGIQGTQGLQGIQGTQGLQGTVGATGAMGTQGETGTTGDTAIFASTATYAFNAGTATYAERAGAHYVGELYGGGIVFWVDHTGQHGLITSLVNMSTSAWSNVSSTLIGSIAQSTWNGSGNSTAIMNQDGHTTSAALLCKNYTNANYGTGIYSDWYLPAIDELSQMYHARYILNKNIEGVGGAGILGTTYHWSSTEVNANYAWYFLFYFGYAGSYDKSFDCSVRAVRAF
ncbi:MAG: DUF1566 domain-containing protein [bacterium]